MLNAKAFANAATAVMIIWFIACTVLSYLAPELIFNIIQSWMHTINLEAIKIVSAPDLGSVIWGLTTSSILTWITAWGAISLYNRWAK